MTDPATVGSMINKYFSSLFNEQSHENFELQGSESIDLDFITENLVLNCIKANGSLNAVWPDGFH